MSNITNINQRDLITFDSQKLELIRSTIAKDLTPNEFNLFISIAKARGLDPVLGQIHAVVRGSGDKAKVNFQVGIDGFRLIAARTGEFAGREETAFDYKGNQLEKAKVTVYRFVNGQKCSWTASAKWSEYFPGEQMGFMWKKLPETMLEKCAEAKALRMAFPSDLSGLYEPSEMDQAEKVTVKDITPKVKDPIAGIKEAAAAVEKDAGEYVFKGGRFDGKKIKEIEVKELVEMVSNMKEYIAAGYKVPTEKMKALENIETFLAAQTEEVAS
mgnify:CR=1 FL=1